MPDEPRIMAVEGGKKSYISTAEVPPPNRSRLWREVISSAYLPLELEFSEPATFNGELALWQSGSASLSRLNTDALCYKRRCRHLVEECDDHYLGVGLSETQGRSQDGGGTLSAGANNMRSCVGQPLRFPPAPAEPHAVPFLQATRE